MLIMVVPVLRMYQITDVARRAARDGVETPRRFRGASQLGLSVRVYLARAVLLDSRDAHDQMKQPFSGTD